jgi:hypothetical protein
MIMKWYRHSSCNSISVVSYKYIINNMLKKIISVVGFAALAAAQGYPEADRVTELWQQPDLSFGFFSGYLPIKDT